MDKLQCHACLATYTDVGLPEEERFHCPKCHAVEPLPEDKTWPLVSKKASGAQPELPDPFSPPPVLPPLGHETNPDAASILRGLRIAGTVAALFALALAVLAVNGAFERRRPPDLPVYQRSPEELAARAAETAEREARRRDIESIVANWPEELGGYRTAGRYFHAVLATDEWEEANGLPLRDGRYRAERDAEGDLRLVRIEEAEQAGEPSAEATVSSEEEASEAATTNGETAELDAATEMP